MDIFGIKKRRKRKEVEDALAYNRMTFVWLDKQAKEAEANGNDRKAEEFRKGCCRTLEVIEEQKRFLYG